MMSISLYEIYKFNELFHELQIGSLQIIFCLYTQLSEVVESWMPGIVLNIPHIC